MESGDWTPPEPGRLTEAEARSEAVFLALRQRSGLVAATFHAEWGASPRALWSAEIEELVAAELLEESSDGDLALTSRGWMLADAVFERFVSPAVD
jgi:coproporphyrinogen III oxidase-like Fe-S oxidoreductase